MWPFKKKTQEPKDIPVPAAAPGLAKSIFSIPGNWSSFEDFHGDLLTSTGAAYMVVGETLMNGKDRRQYRFEMYDREERMEEAFREGGQTTGIDEQTLQEVAGHKSVMYILGETGSLEEAELFAQVGLTLLNAGAIAIKIESAGKAFSKSAYQEIMAEAPDEDLYKLFVSDSIISDDGTVHSCGMHNLGYKDTVVSGEEREDAINLIRLFGYYQIANDPTFTDGQTFQPNPESPVYRVTEEFNSPYEETAIFYNPFGMWRLTRVE